MAPTTRGRARSAAAERLVDIPPEVIGRVLGFLDCAHDLAAANAAARPFRGAPLEHVLRARVRARGHEQALPATLPARARTWVEELLARERIVELSCAHASVVAASTGQLLGLFQGRELVFSVFANADGGAHTCGEDLVFEDGWVSRCPAALGHGRGVADGADHQPVRVPTRVPSLSAVRVRAVAAGRAHVLALDAAGAVYACGENAGGELGLGALGDCDAFVPLRTLAHEVGVGIAAGEDHSAAITAAGAVYSWGVNEEGQLGHGNRKNRRVPARIEALDGVRVGGVAAGASHTLLLSITGHVYSCGYGLRGQLGFDGAELAARDWRQPRPKRIEALAGVRSTHVAAGGDHSLVVDATGGVHSFGYGNSGQLGHGDWSARPRQRLPAPKRIDALAGVRAVRACATRHSSAVLGADGSVHTFGDNTDAQLGVREEPIFQWLPERVPAFQHARVIDCVLGAHHSLFVTADGGVHACGMRTGALGNGVGFIEYDDDDSDTGEWQDRAVPKRVPQLPPLCSAMR